MRYIIQGDKEKLKCSHRSYSPLQVVFFVFWDSAFINISCTAGYHSVLFSPHHWTTLTLREDKLLATWTFSGEDKDPSTVRPTVYTLVEVLTHLFDANAFHWILTNWAVWFPSLYRLYKMGRTERWGGHSEVRRSNTWQAG